MLELISPVYPPSYRTLQLVDQKAVELMFWKPWNVVDAVLSKNLRNT